MIDMRTNADGPIVFSLFSKSQQYRRTLYLKALVNTALLSECERSVAQRIIVPVHRIEISKRGIDRVDGRFLKGKRGKLGRIDFKSSAGESRIG